ncbi:hypothetical protein KSP39_PZI018804 [Platanthera zijinensis]|uniref:Uncharacterized protein n=1 Tax=Platanthera zijinensis TaxID=2320716 RepID=A0AAP0B361_9ASPA
MDFHRLVRKDLQFLCKKNGIAANLTNVAMAIALQALETVEGMEEIQEALGLQSPMKAEVKSSPGGSRKAIHGDEFNIKQSSPLPRQRLLTSKALEEEGKNNELTKVLPKTPATRKSGKAAKTRSSRIRAKNEEEDDGLSETPKPVELRNGKAIGVITRRSTRLSSRRPLEETDTIQSKIRRSNRGKASVDKMRTLCGVDADELEKEDDLGEKKDKEAESYDLSSSLDGGVAKVDHGNCDSGDVFDAENDDLFLEDVLDFEKGYSCIKPDIEDVTKDQGDIHVLPSPLDWVSSNAGVDKPLVESTEDSQQLSATESMKHFHYEQPAKELMGDSRGQFLENKRGQDSGDLLSPGKKYVEVSCDLLQEETCSCFVGKKENFSLFTEISLRDLQESGNGLLEAGVSQVASESTATEIPIETEKSVDLALDSEIVASSIKAYAKSLEQIEDQSNAREIATSEFIDVRQETKISQDVTQNSLTEFPDESFQDDFQNAAKIFFEPQTADYVVEKGAYADLAEENLSNSGEHATNMSIVVTSIEFEEAGREITAVTNKSADENAISGTGKLTTTELVDVAPQISPFQLQIPSSSTKFSETLQETKEETIIHPAVIATLSSPDEILPIESAQLSVIQTQLLNSEEAGMSASGMTVEKVEKWVEKENSVQDDNLKNISLIKLRAMYKQKLGSKKNELERGKSMIKREDVEISGSIVLDEQKIENENKEKLEREKNSMIRQEDFEFCSSIKQELGDKIKQERKTSVFSKLDSNCKQKFNAEDQIQSERKRTPLKKLN